MFSYFLPLQYSGFLEEGGRGFLFWKGKVKETSEIRLSLHHLC